MITAAQAQLMCKKNKIKCTKKKDKLSKKDIRYIFRQIKQAARKGYTSTDIEEYKLNLSISELLEDYGLENVIKEKGYDFNWDSSDFSVILTIKW